MKEVWREEGGGERGRRGEREGDRYGQYSYGLGCLDQRKEIWRGMREEYAIPHKTPDSHPDLLSVR